MSEQAYVPTHSNVQHSPRAAGDDRPPLPTTGGEREILTAFLDWHRATFELKCRGLAEAQLSQRAVPPSGLSLHGLVRHLAGVERWWFRQHFAGEDLPMLHYSDDEPNLDFDRLDGDVEAAFALWRAERNRARIIVAEAPSLDTICRSLVTGREISLRFILVDLIAEYARHNGHADLLRERIDGATGL
ncbi:DinB family protein [Actinacidiphila alni]|uniref:DinB family protein n=1 Tax=Actinacidiphila alni TaxID=380248 RepID=UPI0033D30951